MKYKFKEIEFIEEKTDEEKLELLVNHYNNVLKDLRSGQDRRATFNDQFDSFIVQVDIDSFTEARIANALGKVPTEWSVMDATGARLGDVAKGTTKWTENSLYVFNTSHNNATFKLRFYAGEYNTLSLNPSLSTGANVATGEVFVDAGNGHGSSATAIRRFTNIKTNTGTAITYADSAANGASFTVNNDGTYAVCYGDKKLTSGTGIIGVTVDAPDLTASIATISHDNGFRTLQDIPQIDKQHTTTWVGKLSATNVVRPHTDGNPDDTASLVYFSIVKVA